MNTTQTTLDDYPNNDTDPTLPNDDGTYTTNNTIKARTTPNGTTLELTDDTPDALNNNELLDTIADHTDYRTTIDGSTIGHILIDDDGTILAFYRPAAYVEQPKVKVNEPALQTALDLDDDHYHEYPYRP